MAESVWYRNMGKQSGAVECFSTGHRYRTPNAYAADISLDADAQLLEPVKGIFFFFLLFIYLNRITMYIQNKKLIKPSRA